MSADFDFFFSFYGLLLGLSVAEVCSGLARALSHRARVKTGSLSLMLAIFVLFDITSFFLFAWATRDTVTVSWTLMYGGLLLAVTYYLAAVLIFPRDDEGMASLNEHYWANKRLVGSGILIANILSVSYTIGTGTDVGIAFWIWSGLFFGPLAALIASRSPRADKILLIALNLYYLVAILPIRSISTGLFAH